MIYRTNEEWEPIPKQSHADHCLRWTSQLTRTRYLVIKNGITKFIVSCRAH